MIWTNHQVARLTELRCVKSLTIDRIAIEMDLSYDSVEKKVHALKLKRSEPQFTFWTPDKRAAFIALYNEVPTVSFSEMGKRLGTTKCACLRQARTLKLTPRKRETPYSETRRPHRRKPREVPTLLAALVPTPPAEVREDRAEPTTINPSPQARTCCWPIGNPKSPDFRFCDAPAVLTKPYCQAHLSVAYVKRTA